MNPVNPTSPLPANLWKLFVYSFLAEFWLIAPALMPYYQSRGLSTTESLTVQAIYALGVISLEIPSGHLADRFGRRRALIWCGMLIIVGLTLYALATTFWQFAVAELTLAAAGSLFSGTDAALVYDTLIVRISDHRDRAFRFIVIAGFGPSRSAISAS